AQRAQTLGEQLVDDRGERVAHRWSLLWAPPGRRRVVRAPPGRRRARRPDARTAARRPRWRYELAGPDDDDLPLVDLVRVPAERDRVRIVERLLPPDRLEPVRRVRGPAPGGHAEEPLRQILEEPVECDLVPL